VVICLQTCMWPGQLMPLLLTDFCFSKIHIGFTFLVPAHLGSPGQSAVKRVRVLFIIIGGQFLAWHNTTNYRLMFLRWSGRIYNTVTEKIFVKNKRPYDHMLGYVLRRLGLLRQTVLYYVNTVFTDCWRRV